MNSQKLWPTVQALGRTLVYNKSDIINQSIRAYNYHNFGNSHFNVCTQNPLLEEHQSLRQNLIRVGRGSYVKVVSRKLSSGTYLFCREFNDGENEHAHDILCALPEYKETVLDVKKSTENFQNFSHWATLIDKNWNSVDDLEIVQSFTQLSKLSNQYSLELEDRQFRCLCQKIAERMCNMSDDHLMQLLVALSHWPPAQSNDPSNFLLLWNSLDEACAARIKSWDFSKIFLVADHWYALRLSKISIYFTKLMTVVGVKLQDLTPSQLVQFMFYANLNRDMGSMKKDVLISKIKTSVGHISVEELGIIAMGLFKTQTNISDDALNKDLIEKMAENIDTISNHALGSILKFLNKGLPGNAYKQCHELLDMLNPHLDNFNNLVLLQVALLGNNLLVFHREVMEKIGVRFGNCITELRLKDIERFTYALMLYKFVPNKCPHVINDIIMELRKPERIVEINHFPKCFVSCVNYLVTMGCFPLDLISASFQPSMLQLLQSMASGEMGRELSEMSWSLRIEGPHYYPGYQLDPELSQHLTKTHLGRIPNYSTRNKTHQERMLLDVHSKLAAMLGSETLLIDTIILPHFTHPDIIFCTDVNGEPLEIPYEYRMLPLEALKLPIGFNSGFIWNALMIGGRNSYIRETTELRGNLEMKKRQLQKLGYHVTVIPYTSYSKKSIKYKLACLEWCLKETSSLKLDGRTKVALNTLKAMMPPEKSSEEVTQ